MESIRCLTYRAMTTCLTKQTRKIPYLHRGYRNYNPAPPIRNIFRLASTIKIRPYQVKVFTNRRTYALKKSLLVRENSFLPGQRDPTHRTRLPSCRWKLSWKLNRAKTLFVARNIVRGNCRHILLTIRSPVSLPLTLRDGKINGLYHRLIRNIKKSLRPTLMLKARLQFIMRLFTLAKNTI